MELERIEERLSGRFQREIDGIEVNVLKIGEEHGLKCVSDPSKDFEELNDPYFINNIFMALEIEVLDKLEVLRREDTKYNAANGYMIRKQTDILPIREPSIQEVVDGVAIPMRRIQILHVQFLNYAVIPKKDEDILDM